MPERLAALVDAVPGRLVFTTSFGLEDQADRPPDLHAKLAIEVATLDTGRLFPVDLQALAGDRGALRRRASAPSIPMPPRVAAMVADSGINGFYYSKDARHRLLRGAQGRAARPRARRRGRLGDRAARRPVGPARRDRPRRLGRGARPGQVRTPVRLDARRRPPPSASCAACRSTRSTPRASSRSAASPAPARSGPASPSAPAAGGGRRRGASECGLHVGADGRLVRTKGRHERAGENKPRGMSGPLARPLPLGRVGERGAARSRARLRRHPPPCPPPQGGGKVEGREGRPRRPPASRRCRTCRSSTSSRGARWWSSAERGRRVEGRAASAAARRGLAGRGGRDCSRLAATVLPRGWRHWTAPRSPSPISPTRPKPAASPPRARAAGVPVNIIDRTELCDVQFGTIVNRAPVVIAISTDGAAPMLGQSIRARIESVLPLGLSAWAKAAMAGARRLKARLPHFADRRAFWRRFTELAWAEARSRARRSAISRLCCTARRRLAGKRHCWSAPAPAIPSC